MFSKLPVRQVTAIVVRFSGRLISKLPVRQVTLPPVWDHSSHSF